MLKYTVVAVLHLALFSFGLELKILEDHLSNITPLIKSESED